MTTPNPGQTLLAFAVMLGVISLPLILSGASPVLGMVLLWLSGVCCGAGVINVAVERG